MGVLFENSFVLEGELYAALRDKEAVKNQMKIEKKLIVCSILAITIGIATIVPLAFFMTPAKAQTNPEDQPQFDLSIPYAYISDYWNTDNPNHTYGYVYSMVFQATPTFDPNAISANATLEYYNVEISSEKGSIANLTYSTYAYNTSKFLDFSFQFQDQWFNSSVINSKDSTGNSVSENGTSLGYMTGAGENWDRSIGVPETLTITVHRLGWVVINSNTTETHLASPDAILQIQLQRYGEGFMYNHLFSDDVLAQMDPLYAELQLYR